MNNPEGYVLVQVKQLAQWREWANNVAAWSTKSDRSSEVARLKASISGAMVSATQPTASNAGEREIHSNRDAYNAGYEDALQTAGVSVLVGHHHTPAALATQPQTGLPDYYISGPYTVGKWAGWHSVCETATARVVHHFKPDQPQEVQKPVGVVESAAAGAGGFHCRLTGSMPRVGDAVYTTAQPEQVAQDREDAELFAWYVGDARTESNELAKLELRRINGETASLDEYRDAIRAARASGKGGGKP